MSIWKKVFTQLKTTKGTEKYLSKFADWVKLSIKLIGNIEGELDIESLLQYLERHGIPYEEAVEIIIFLPTAFCRKLFPELNWPSEYIEHYVDDKREIIQRYKNNPRYIIIQSETNKYWMSKPMNKEILNIVSMSSEFNVINKMLNDGGKLENVKINPSYIER